MLLFLSTFVHFFKITVMKELREYQIPFIGLKNEVHHFNYEIDERFFANFEESLVKRAKVFIDISFDKKDRLFILNFDVSGSIETDCDRCGETFNLPIHGNYSLYVKIGEMPTDNSIDEDVIWIAEGASVLDVAESIYDFIHLSIPMKKTHLNKTDGTLGCNQEILKKLGLHDDQQEADPRWDILKSLTKN